MPPGLPMRDSSEGNPDMGTDYRLVEEIFLLALFIISTIANSLSLLVFCRRPGLRTISNRFVINLLATNLVTILLLAPALVGEYTAGVEEIREQWMRASDATASAGSLAALLAVLLIAIDQHHAVTDPLRCHTRLLQRRPLVLIVAAWTAATAAGVARATVAALRDSSDNCSCLDIKQEGLPVFCVARIIETILSLLYLVAGVMTPAFAVCVMYARIYKAARSSGLRARAHGASALQLQEPNAPLPDLVEEGEGLTLKIDVQCPENGTTVNGIENERTKYGPFLLPPEKPRRCPSVASLRTQKRDGKSTEDIPRLPSASSAPTLAVPLLTVSTRTSAPSTSSRITSIRCRISNASLFRYREESRAARVGLLTSALVMLHIPHALSGPLTTMCGEGANEVRVPALALLLLATAVSPFLFALRSRRVQREARRILMPKKSPWDRSSDAAASAAVDGQRARAALDLLRTLSPGGDCGGGGVAGTGSSSSESTACRSSFSSGGSTQLSSTSEE